MNKEEMVVDLYNIDPPIANALRRIIIAEVPTMAIGSDHGYSDSKVTSLTPQKLYIFLKTHQSCKMRSWRIVLA